MVSVPTQSMEVGGVPMVNDLIPCNCPRNGHVLE